MRRAEANDFVIICMDKQNLEERKGEERPSPEQLWQSLRNQFAAKEQSINEFQAADLIEQWLMTEHQQSIENLQKRLETHPERFKTLRQIIEEVLNSEKENNWIIRQRYNYEHASLITSKVKETYELIIVNQRKKEDHIEKNQKRMEFDESDKKKDKQIKQSDALQTALQSNPSNRSSKLPQIRPKGKVFSPQQMASTFHLREEVIQQYQPRNPHLFSQQTKEKTVLRSNLFNNKYLKMAFDRFCKQSYSQRGLFSEFFKESDKMNLNKWMVFCKQFDFNEKFHNKHLIQIYQQATHFASTMNISQFLTAVGLLQQKYIDKYHTGQHFVEDVLKINSEASFRIKMENLKVRYGGPMRNSFEMATYPEHLRLEEVEKQKQFKAKKKEKDMVLIKGMYEEHLKAEVQRLREEREKNKISRMAMNRSLVEQKKVSEDKISHKIARTSRPQSLNYSKLFHIKNPHAAKTPNLSSYGPQENQLYMTENRNKPQKKAINPQTKEIKKPFERSSLTDHFLDPPRRQWLTEPQSSTWLTRLRSDSEQSDQIFKQHLQIEKKIQKSKMSSKAQNIMAELQSQSTKVNQMMKEIQEDEDLMQTGSNFKSKTKNQKFY